MRFPWRENRDHDAVQIGAPVCAWESDIVRSTPGTPALRRCGGAVELGQGVETAGDVEEPAVLGSAAAEFDAYLGFRCIEGGQGPS